MTEEEAQEHGFLLAGKIQRSSDNRLSFNLDKAYTKGGAKAKDHGWVYLWVKVNSGRRFDVCYVGKAGNTLMKRCKEHVGGFGGKGTGAKRAKLINEYLNGSSKNRILLYAHKSALLNVFGIKVSKCGVEEVAMIEKLSTTCELWNRIR